LGYSEAVIKNFGDKLTKKIFSGEKLTKKERKQIGALVVEKAETRLDQLDTAEEKDLLLAPHLFYHHLKGTNRYSIDAHKKDRLIER
jgi:plasmid maintenance system killer protein